MCLVIDTCCLARVFCRHNAEHADFAPVLQWVTVGDGSMIYGGTKYKTELGRMREIVKIVVELQRAGRAIEVDKSNVDRIEAEIKTTVRNARFNDEHLVAIVIVSRCRLICTCDEAAMPYLQDRDLYSDYSVKPPKIYRYKSHAKLCCRTNIVAKYRRQVGK
jgi:hypothetical protein